MRPKTTAEKVRLYEILVHGLFSIGLYFAMLSALALRFAFRPTALVLFVAAAILLTTAFASSRTKFAKEVEEVIIPFCRERNYEYGRYPTTDAQCNELRKGPEIFDDLKRCAEAVIGAQETVARYWHDKQDEAYRAAIVKEQNAQRAFKTRWDFYERVGPTGVLPLKNPSAGTYWIDADDFLQGIRPGSFSAATSQEQEYA